MKEEVMNASQNAGAKPAEWIARAARSSRLDLAPTPNQTSRNNATIAANRATPRISAPRIILAGRGTNSAAKPAATANHTPSVNLSNAIEVRIDVNRTEKIIHDAVGGVRPAPHQIDRDFALFVRGHEVDEGQYPVLSVHRRENRG